MKVFFGFLVLSGLGWLCDFGTFTLLSSVIDAPPFAANFFSSYVGVTFVWFTSLTSIFKSSGEGKWRFLLIYWTYQFISIIVYSQLLRLAAHEVADMALPGEVSRHAGVVAKLGVTPLNLATNFIFMKHLTRFMRLQRSTHV
jgi:putative flippase GtrA